MIRSTFPSSLSYQGVYRRVRNSPKYDRLGGITRSLMVVSRGGLYQDNLHVIPRTIPLPCRPLSESTAKIDKTQEITRVIEPWNTTYRFKDASGSQDNRYGRQIEVKECHLCEKPNKSKLDNVWKLTINCQNGSFYCFRCSTGGGWKDFKRKLGQYVENGSNDPVSNSSSASSSSSNAADKASSTVEEDTKTNGLFALPHQEFFHRYHTNLFPTSTSSGNATLDTARAQVKEYLNVKRGLNDKVLEKYMVGFTIQQFLSGDSEQEQQWVDHICVTLPWIAAKDDPALNWSSYKDIASGGSPCVVTDKRQFTILRMKYR